MTDKQYLIKKSRSLIPRLSSSVFDLSPHIPLGVRKDAYQRLLYPLINIFDQDRCYDRKMLHTIATVSMSYSYARSLTYTQSQHFLTN